VLLLRNQAVFGSGMACLVRLLEASEAGRKLVQSVSLINDHAMELAKRNLQAVEQFVPEEELKRIFGLFYAATKATLLKYEERIDRLQQRIHPLGK
jgi:hypothetical protein